MNGLGALVMAVVLSALAAFLITRMVVFFSGAPRIPGKVLAALAVRPGTRGRGGSRLDLVMVAVILLLLETAAVITVSDAVRLGDLFTAAVFSLQFVAAIAWWLFLRRRRG